MTQLPHTAFQSTLDDAVAEFARETRFPLAFGGFESRGITTVTALAGHRTMSLLGLQVRHSRGLGGRAMSEARPRLTGDYARSQLITHDYDTEIGAEDVMALLAMPVILNGAVRAVLYGATRDGTRPGTAFLRSGAAVARSLAHEIRVEDEVERRLAAHEAAREAAALEAALEAARCTAGVERSGITEIPSDILEELRGGHAELRMLTAEVSDPEIRDRLTDLGKRLARVGTPDGVTVEVHLAPREIDVLAHAARGSTNAGIGQALQLAESTVKSYLKSAMTKLGVSTRHAAVIEARRGGLIP